MPLPAPEFVRRVMQALNCEGPTDLVRILDLGPHGYPRVHRWLSGQNEPDYEATMLMLEKAGWLSLNREPLDPDEETEIARQLRVAAEAIAAILARLEQR